LICTDKRNRALKCFSLRKIAWLYPELQALNKKDQYNEINREEQKCVEDTSALFYECFSSLNYSREDCDFKIGFTQLTRDVIMMTIMPSQSCHLCEYWIDLIFKFKENAIEKVELLEHQS
jgi:hypothetical protein